MQQHITFNEQEVRSMIRSGEIAYGGNARLGIYGNLHCTAGKRMKRGNRVFFKTLQEAKARGFRPCGHCMHAAYKKWKDGFI